MVDENLTWLPMTDFGNARRLMERSARLTRRGLAVLGPSGNVIAWLEQAEGFTGSTDQLQQQVGLDPCDDWSAECLKLQFEDKVRFFAVCDDACADDAWIPADHLRLVEARIGDLCADRLRRIRLHDNVPLALASRDAQQDASVSTARNGHVALFQDRQLLSPSGSRISPKVAEAGESETPLPGGGQADD